MSELSIFTEVSPRDPGMPVPAEPGSLRPILDGTTAPQESQGVHCGAAMQLTTPALGMERASYTFAPDGFAVDPLPPVWRCACGFQLDAWAGGTPTAAPTASFPA